ncbi:MAG: peptide deformylase [Patescibacteria group bacterium]|mgnify:FL=1
MKILDLVKIPDELLRTPTKEVTVFDDQLIEFVRQMAHTMHCFNGIGLAANQVGDLRRIFVIDEKLHKHNVFINPKIVKKSMFTNRYMEGCLSIPDKSFVVPRYYSIDIDYQDMAGERQVLWASRGLAEVIQHEIDHLENKLIMDY